MYQDAFFFPNKENIKKICRYIDSANKTILICIFTLTNDDLAASVINAHKRGVQVRLITDDEQAMSNGSDI